MSRDPLDHIAETLERCLALQGRDLQGLWIFGSRARGDERNDSDMDIAILCHPPLGLEVAALIDQLSRVTGRELDIVDLATAPATLAWEILTRGRLVLERDELRVEAFLRETRHAEEDEAQRNRMVVLARAPRVGSRGS
jgi:predicted nucleotidyltransferase